MDPVSSAAQALAGCRRILAFTGAGISTESGIPDFRGPEGLWTKVDPEEFTYSRYLESSETRRTSWRMRAESRVFEAEPNPAHRAIVDLWGIGRLLACITQNIDGLHQRAGLPDEAVIELHGNARETVCIACGDRQATASVIERVVSGESDPTCRDCGGILKAAVVFFGEAMPREELMRAALATSEADAVLAVGSTLSVFPAASFPIEVVEGGHPMVIVNRGPTELDDLATVIVDGAAGEILPMLVAELAGRLLPRRRRRTK
ncbi:MAG: Sir2 family NAD-dependent protein deacetylase [Actinomycetota bacterium]|nr:Sir2 family NAD-dependent protein deacetylase [Actinomycetota bacterium]